MARAVFSIALVTVFALPPAVAVGSALNSLLVSGPPDAVDALTERIGKLDAQPDYVMIKVLIAELKPAKHDTQTQEMNGDNSPEENSPCMAKDGSAWLAWAKKHGRLEVISRPQVMTFKNQPAYIMIGKRVPRLSTEQIAGRLVNENLIDGTGFIGLTMGLTPRMVTSDSVVIDLDIERTSIDAGGSMSGPSERKATAQTSICAKAGQTTVIRGPLEPTKQDTREVIIAITSYIVTEK